MVCLYVKLFRHLPTSVDIHFFCQTLCWLGLQEITSCLFLHLLMILHLFTLNLTDFNKHYWEHCLASYVLKNVKNRLLNDFLGFIVSF